jgi:hypothetical protein
MKSHYSFGRLILAVSVTACSSESGKAERTIVDSVTVANSLPAPMKAAVPQQPAQLPPNRDSESAWPWTLACSPDTIRPGDTLTIRMSTPHGYELTVVREAVGLGLSDFERSRDRTTYRVIDPLIGRPRLRYSLIPADQFREMPVLRLPVDVTAPPMVYGRDSTLESVFSQPGKYTINVGENMASDYSNRVTQCSVTLVLPTH